MIQTIDSFKLRFMLPKGYRYYEEATVRLNDELQNAWSLLRSSENPGENVSHAIENAKKSSEVIATNLEDFLKRITNRSWMNSETTHWKSTGLNR